MGSNYSGKLAIELTRQETVSLSDESFPRYGEVWIVELDPVVGAEIGKRRPALLVSNNISNRYSDTITVLPITSAYPRRNYPHEVAVPAGTAGLLRNSRIKANMVRTLDKSRMVRFLGMLPSHYYSEVNRALRVHLNIS